MAILKVSRLGHPVLREKASDVEIKDIKAGKFKQLIDDMVETMHAYEGVGLAGPQVHLPLRARHVIVVPHELDLHEADHHHDRPRGEDREELEEPALGERHQAPPALGRMKDEG